jgi:hypothetical protein
LKDFALPGWAVVFPEQASSHRRLDFDPAWEPFPTRAQIDALASAGVCEIDVRKPLDLLASGGERTAHAVAFLRECRAARMPLRWRLGNHDIPLSAIAHVQAPLNARAVSAHWPASIEPIASLHWRNGPDFITVRDARDPQNEARYVIDDPPLVALFKRLQEPAPANPAELALLSDLIGEQMLVIADGFAVTTPARMRV